MLVAERHQKIVEIVNERKSIRVTELGKIFSVTDETIRRDLEKLESENKLARSHGGAVYIEMTKETPEVPYSEREITHVFEKKEIAREAIMHITEGDKIILDASTSAWYMAKILPDIPLTVVTNSIKVAMELSNKSNITVISAGGTLLTRSLSFVGPLAESSIDGYHVNKAFISCKGLHLENGLSESNEQQARVKKKMMDIADLVYILVDHNKFGVQAFAHVSDLDSIGHIITDNDANEDIINQIKEKSLNIIRV
ncbi:DeoR/GlpR family DNA-binding transcription regulator [Aquibacillus rhizosphaerae]|uniref:DeoR/GlpR family DNA-binding transcription regulator n=1 Tax=Aquibacillus rhizosphaerae TaxID=3051431 RepID=A0ABT7L2S2_9BACI|nr:DeoR/GlpR family DNA-binding transcription regulator [Aquibacillus sp. LR5S19]MDL4840158.1 DeoR/GlpR family DNA-binding transcription regulator [Aquibacillus sp. LR5S19]